ncbi:MAG: hypothetical protein M3525_00835 [Acidobacteriota bacterium]|nr:hypothetical protein [Acidobacteriota bacterium]
MNQTHYEQIIAAGVKHLSPERQREVADFVYFLREREAGSAKYEQLIEADLAEFSKEESKHLEEEFADYDRVYPRR